MSEKVTCRRTSERFDGSNHLTAPDTFEDIRCGFLVALSKAFQTRRFLPPDITTTLELVRVVR